MLGNYEIRRFEDGAKVWIGHYQNLANVLHWHFECEVICIVEGSAQVTIGEHVFSAKEGDCFFCAGEELHNIVSGPDDKVDILIFDKNIVKEITEKYELVSPRIARGSLVENCIRELENVILSKGVLYREALENLVRGFVIEVFRENEITRRSEKQQFSKSLVQKISKEYAHITFEEAARFSGYSKSHFSKMFREIFGLSFSQYLNVIKVEHAIEMMRAEHYITMTAISRKCGFSTVRNFNHVFKNITGYSPRMLPEDYRIDTGLRILEGEGFDPTREGAVRNYR